MTQADILGQLAELIEGIAESKARAIPPSDTLDMVLARLIDLSTRISEAALLRDSEPFKMEPFAPYLNKPVWDNDRFKSHSDVPVDRPPAFRRGIFSDDDELDSD